MTRLLKIQDAFLLHSFDFSVVQHSEQLIIATHLLAKYALSKTSNQIWVEECPPIHHILSLRSKVLLFLYQCSSDFSKKTIHRCGIKIM
jgi:hypothetical protein